MKIKMLADKRGSNDGRFVDIFRKNEIYDTELSISKDLAIVFLRLGVAERYEDLPIGLPFEAKMDIAYENKMEKKIENKTIKPKRGYKKKAKSKVKKK